MSDKGKASPPAPSPVRSFDPLRLADLEYRAWTGYYRRRWLRVLAASVGLVRAGFGLSWPRTLYGAWLVLRANQLWAAQADNDPPRARACMRRFYALIRRAYGEPAHPARAAELEIGWWRAHRELQHRAPQNRELQNREPQHRDDAPPAQSVLVAALTGLYCYLYGEPEAALRPAAQHRAQAMDLSDQWVRQGCRPDSALLPLEHAALVRCYAALLAAVHH